MAYFENLFTSNGLGDMDPVLNLVEPKINSDMAAELAAPFRREEVILALSQMHPNKSPGPDGMNALFYQSFWNFIGEDVVDKIMLFLNNVEDISAINQTHLVLIPKKKHCESPVDFRPISLCNVMYKLVSKVLANRLKKVLPDVIHESHSGFVPGRLITDNVLVAYECFHYLRKKKKGKKGYLGLKLDMSKAYDRVEWSFVENMMRKLGFPECYASLVMKCMTTATFSVLVNGQPSRTFTPSRGLRQGDPISPFLFVLCAEGLSCLLRDAERKKLIHGVKIGRRVSPISHLFFADDSLLFIRATEDEVENVMEALSIYEAASGQKLNMEKSEMSYSRNIEPEKIDMLQMKLNFKAVEGHDKYLGLPTYVGSSKKRIFQVIQDRVWKKLKGWKGQCLSQAGREILIKAVAQSIPTYAMQCFRLPKSILDGMERMCRSFFWGQQKEEKKLAWVAWEKMFLPKKEGGLGIRNFDVFNRALLAKQAWRVITMPDSLMAKVLKGKYFPNSSFLEAKQNPNASFTWNSIFGAKSLVMKGVCRVIGNGRTTRIWHDPWLPRMTKATMLQQDDNTNPNAPFYVSDIIEEGRWKNDIMAQFLRPLEIQEIQKLPLPIHDLEDYWMWKHTKHGEFSVRSAYYMELFEERKSLPSSSVPDTNKVWRWLWSSKTQPKAKLFGWKSLHNGVPVRVNLAQRGMMIDKVCPRCGEEDETIEHLLLHCETSRQIWYLSPLRLDVRLGRGGKFRDWVEVHGGNKKEDAWWSLFWMICWQIWLGRNRWVFEGKRKEVHEIVASAVQGALDYENSNESGAKKMPVSEGSKGWSAPVEGTYKLNTDAAMFENSHVGLGGVVRVFEGDVLVAICNKVTGSDDVAIAEALSARQGVKVALEAGFSNLVLEVDNLKLYNCLATRRYDTSIFGQIVRDILCFESQCSKLLFSHVKRMGNRVAHGLAKLSKSCSSQIVWLEETPDEIARLVMTDKLKK